MYNSEQVDPDSQKKTWSWNDKINTLFSQQGHIKLNKNWQ